MIYLKRAYDTASDKDGIRILVDRLWPRGVSKEEADLDLWIKDISPSEDLRKWFEHDPKKWEDFEEKYFKELDNKKDVIGHYPDQWKKFKEKYLKDWDEHPDILYQIKRLSEDQPVTLIYAAHDEQDNNAVALKKYINKNY